jgi:hypothetical protein
VRRHFLLAGILAVLPKRGRGQDIVPPPLAGIAAGALTRVIESTRSQAIADGVRPLPSSIFRGLLGFFPDGLLRRVRYGTGEAGQTVLPSLAFSYGDAAAITLGDVVLFRDPHQARTDLKLWAHELTHVLQYQRWGIAGFAERYVADARAVEREAYENADRFAAWRAR